MASTVGKVISCRGAVAWEVNKPVTMETIEVGVPLAGEVRLKVAASGVCHSDAHALSGHIAFVGFPCVLGHEGAGVVESVGPGVTAFSVGDHVIPLFVSHCGECKFCKSPLETNTCSASDYAMTRGLLRDGTSRLSCKGKSLFQFLGIGCFAEYAVVSEVALAKINPSAPLDKVCLLGCGVPTGFGAAVNAANVQPGSTCAVWGLGGVGLAAVMGCRFAGASRIIGVDLNKDKFPLARQFGCTDFVDPSTEKEPVPKVIAALTDGGVDFALECVGTERTVRAALDSTHRGWGSTVMVGVPPAGKDFAIDPLGLFTGRQLKSTLFGGYKPKDIPGLVDLYLNKKIMLDEFITHVMPLEKVNEAFDLMLAGKSIRSVVTL